MKWIITSGALALLAMALPGQGRNAPVWEHLRTQYDADGDGRITREEHGRGESQFNNLDRNGDGVISEADFGRGVRRAGNANQRPRGDRDAAMARNLGEMYGTFLNRDGKPGLSEAEWTALIASLQPDAEGSISAANLRGLTGLAGQGGMARMAGDISRLLDRDRDGTVTEADMRAVFTAMDRNGDGLVEQGVEISMPPGVGEVAPDFTLPFAKEDGKKLTLSSFRDEKPVALIFGSYT